MIKDKIRSISISALNSRSLIWHSKYKSKLGLNHLLARYIGFWKVHDIYHWSSAAGNWYTYTLDDVWTETLHMCVAIRES